MKRTKSSSFNIVDAQSVKNADTAEQKGYDGGKNVSGIKRHISVDILGLPHAVHVTTANVTDRKGALEMYEQYPELKETIEAILTDGGYTGEKFRFCCKVEKRAKIMNMSFVFLYISHCLFLLFVF
ncbi:transposase [Bacillus thuringiensis]|uniref:transposase n=1 Tax=Bacillus thuringiensis TaxID=1428 RepID=UPI003EC0F2AF